MKPGSNFKMPKSTKRMLATYIDPHKRGMIKRHMIQAHLAASVIVKHDKNDKNKRG